MKDYRDFAADLVKKAMARGAGGADVYLEQARRCTIRSRMGRVETLQESGSEGVGLRVFLGDATALVYSTDLSKPSLERLLDEAFALVSVMDRDPANRLPPAETLGGPVEPLRIFDDAVGALAVPEKIARLEQMEAAGRAVDARITNSNGAWWDDLVARVTVANSQGFVGQYDHTRVGLGVSLVAETNGVKQMDGWSSSARFLECLQEPTAIGRKAAARVLRKLGARQVATQHVPVVFDPRVGEDLLRILFGALEGFALVRRSSFLVGKLGQKLGGSCLNLVDDATLPGRLGSRPFDGEGVRSQRTRVVDRGVLTSYLCDTYTATKLRLPGTANASRRYDRTPVVGPSNFYLEAGSTPPEDIIASVSKGLFVTRLYWVGTNLATGDYSRGAEGIWIEDGRLTHPVQEVTIAGNVLEMLERIALVGSDLEFRGPVASPTLLVSDLVISGH